MATVSEHMLPFLRVNFTETLVTRKLARERPSTGLPSQLSGDKVGDDVWERTEGLDSTETTTSTTVLIRLRRDSRSGVAVQCNVDPSTEASEL